MGTHPNVILMVALTPDDLTRKTYRTICAAEQIDEEDGSFYLGEDSYQLRVMESGYDADSQISAKEGDIVAHSLVTYGYGEAIEWADLQAKMTDLQEWTRRICQTVQIHEVHYRIGANYW
jgi:hypothetical protein